VLGLGIVVPAGQFSTAPFSWRPMPVPVGGHGAAPYSITLSALADENQREKRSLDNFPV
jgi:hypothetical protein